MRVVEIRVERSTFGETLAEMREWIDRNGGDPVKFESSIDRNGRVLIRLDFVRPEVGFAFRRDWVQAEIAEACAA